MAPRKPSSHARPTLTIDQDGRVLDRNLGPAPRGNLPAVRSAFGFAAALRAAPATRGGSLLLWGLGQAVRQPAFRQALRRAAYALGRMLGRLLRGTPFGRFGDEGPPGWDMTGWTNTYTNACGNPTQAYLNPNSGVRVCSGSGAWDATDYAEMGLLAENTLYWFANYAGIVTETGTTPIVARWRPGSTWRRLKSDFPGMSNSQVAATIVVPGRSKISASVPEPYNRDNWLPTIFPDLLPPGVPSPALAPAPNSVRPPYVPSPYLPSDQQRWSSSRYGVVPRGGIVEPSFQPHETPLEHDTIVIEPMPSSNGAGGRSPPPPRVHLNTPPRYGEKERKAKVPRALAIALNIGGKLTEAADVVDALYDALPRHVKLKFRNTNYLLQSATPQAKLAVLIEHYDKIDLEDALVGLAENQIEDYVLGRVGQLGKQWAKDTGRFTGSIDFGATGRYYQMVARTQARRR